MTHTFRTQPLQDRCDAGSSSSTRRPGSPGSGDARSQHRGAWRLYGVELVRSSRRRAGPGTCLRGAESHGGEGLITSRGRKSLVEAFTRHSSVSAIMSGRGSDSSRLPPRSVRQLTVGFSPCVQGVIRWIRVAGRCLDYLVHRLFRHLQSRSGSATGNRRDPPAKRSTCRPRRMDDARPLHIRSRHDKTPGRRDG